MSNFIQIGHRVVNLDWICAAEREGKGKVTVYLAAPGRSGSAMEVVFSEQDEADQIWIKLANQRGDLTDLSGGPYSITDNEVTESGQRQGDD